MAGDLDLLRARAGGGGMKSVALHELAVLALDDIESADSGGDIYAHFIEVGIFAFPAGHLDGEIRAGQSHLNEAAHFLQFFFLDPAEGIEVFYFAADGAVESGSVKKRDGANPAFTGNEVGPAFLGADAQRADQSNARYDYTASQLFSAPC